MVVIRLGIARGQVSGERQGVRGKVMYKESERETDEGSRIGCRENVGPGA